MINQKYFVDKGTRLAEDTTEFESLWDDPEFKMRVALMAAGGGNDLINQILTLRIDRDFHMAHAKALKSGGVVMYGLLEYWWEHCHSLEEEKEIANKRIAELEAERAIACQRIAELEEETVSLRAVLSANKPRGGRVNTIPHKIRDR